ncbi:MAG: Wadjet anti-phage system protein JetD domain-containing protein [Rectinemataceae bacterium]
MLKKPEDLRQALAKRLDAEWAAWACGRGQWPLRVMLGKPASAEWQDAAAGLRAWVEAWRAEEGACELEWEEVQSRAHGRQTLPKAALFRDAESLAAWLGRPSALRRALAVRDRILARWPGSGAAIEGNLAQLVALDDADLERLEAVVEWLHANPASGLFRRAVPVRGIHSKWLEARASMVAEFVSALSGRAGFGGNSAGTAVPAEAARGIEGLGLRAPPRLIRWRLLDQALRDALGGLDSAATSVAELAGLRFDRALIIENLETGLALPDVPGCIAILHLGYAVEALSAIPWLASIPVGYWGDLDTHGLAILGRARGQTRSRLPHITSIMMDRPTLLEHRDLWSFEETARSGEVPSGLDAAESELFSELRDNVHGVGVRLEQERIPLDWAADRIRAWYNQA